MTLHGGMVGWESQKALSILWRRLGKMGHAMPQLLTQTHHGLQRNCGELKK